MKQLLDLIQHHDLWKATVLIGIFTGSIWEVYHRCFELCILF